MKQVILPISILLLVTQFLFAEANIEDNTTKIEDNTTQTPAESEIDLPEIMIEIEEPQ